jgi:hypothetical protein
MPTCTHSLWGQGAAEGTERGAGRAICGDDWIGRATTVGVDATLITLRSASASGVSTALASAAAVGVMMGETAEAVEAEDIG